MTERYRSQPIPMMAKEEKKIGNFLTAIMKLHKLSVCCPNGHFWNNISQRLTGKVMRHSRKSEVAKVPMNELWAVRIFFLDTMAPRTEKLNNFHSNKIVPFHHWKWKFPKIFTRRTKIDFLEQLSTYPNHCQWVPYWPQWCTKRSSTKSTIHWSQIHQKYWTSNRPKNLSSWDILYHLDEEPSS